MHLFSPEIGMMGTSGIVGPSILQACGGGYSAKLLKNGTVAVAFFGDGAVNNGAFHEGLNMASIWKLPVLFVCENNQFATEVPFAYASGIPDIGRRAANYGMPGFEVDGNDVLEVYRIAGEAIAQARVGGGPTLLECKTYRTRTHAEGMGDFTYRTREEVAAWKEQCPIARLRKSDGVGHRDAPAETQFDAIDAEVSKLVAVAREFAESSPVPSSESATAHVYSACSSPTAKAPLPTLQERQISFVAATLEALEEAMAADPTIFVMGEGIGAIAL